MEPVEPRHTRNAAEVQMVPIRQSSSADWEVDLAPGLLLQTVDLTPYANSSALKVSQQVLTRLAHTPLQHDSGINDTCTSCACSASSVFCRIPP